MFKHPSKKETFAQGFAIVTACDNLSKCCKGNLWLYYDLTKSDVRTFCQFHAKGQKHPLSFKVDTDQTLANINANLASKTAGEAPL